jgi:Rhodopirellula transposase DDE domain
MDLQRGAPPGRPVDRQGFQIGRQKVANLLRDLGYILQANRKAREGSHHPDRDA